MHWWFVCHTEEPMAQWIWLSTVVTVSLVVVVSSSPPRFELREEWNLWKDKHGKSYESEHVELERHLVWLSNKEYIDQHNANSHIFGFTLAMNHYGDLTEAEYAEKHLTYEKTEYRTQKWGNKVAKITIFTPPKNANWPEQIDWRTKDAVTSVKDQIECGASYAFASMGSLEGAYSLAYGSSNLLSEQNIIDCSVPEGNNGCNGGNMYNSYMYVIFNDGVNTDKSYPFEGIQKTCNFTYDSVGATMTGIVIIPSGSESYLQAAVASAGPIATAVDARTNGFRFYSSGIYSSSRCSSYNVNHAVLITGYGSYNGKDYWLLKNSWGTTWGMSGYIMMTRNSYNQCGIATDASYPSL